MFKVSAVNLTPDARSATEGSGSRELGQLSADELIGLLNTFAEIDAVQNNDADPEIWVQVRRDRYVIRTAQKKLFLQNSRNLQEPAYVLSADEIIAELDGSAAARRTTPPMSMTPSSPDAPASTGTSFGHEIAPLPEVAPRSWPFGLIGLVLLLGGYVAYTELVPRGGGVQPALTPLTTAERAAEDTSLTGVYMTGSEPGQHGIVILGDGKMKLFQINAQAAPGTAYGTYRLGRRDGKICLATDQPGGLITVTGRDSLEFGGESYKRIP